MKGFCHRQLYVSAFLMLGILARVQAQAPADQALDRAQLLRASATLRDDSTPQTTGTDDNHAVASPNDPDLGEQAILKRSEHYRAFTVSVAAPISYTSNVALTRTGEQSDALFTPGVAVIYAPRLTRTLFASFSVSQQFFYYDRFSELNFGSLDLRAGLTYVLPQFHNLLLRADYSYNRLTNNDYDEFFSNHALDFGAELPFRIGRAQQISVGVEADVNLHADPVGPGRHDFSAFVGYSVNLTRDLTLNAVGRLALRDYVDVDRTDVSGILALSASYRFTKWCSLNAISTFATNDSSRDVFDYNVVNIGGALGLTFRF
ncbi:MAG: hypothetical protein ACR2ID_10860 [Chthoniobacterales bacterium]